MLRPDFTQAKNYILQHKLLSLLAICVIGITLTLGLRHLSNQSTSKKAVMKPIVHTQTVSRRPLYNYDSNGMDDRNYSRSASVVSPV